MTAGMPQEGPQQPAGATQQRGAALPSGASPLRLPKPFLRPHAEAGLPHGVQASPVGYHDDLDEACEMAGQFRAIWCEQYEACLDFAARENWASFSCKRCKLRKLAVRPSATAYAHERSQFDPRCGVSVNHVVGKSAWRHR